MEENDYNSNLHKDATPNLFENAKTLRHKETEAEKKLWTYLRNRQLKGKKFRRQHPLASYVLDFYCHECKLAVELDGAHHNDKMNRQYDEDRTFTLNDHGITVLRFYNSEIMKEIESVLERICVKLY